MGKEKELRSLQIRWDKLLQLGGASNPRAAAAAALKDIITYIEKICKTVPPFIKNTYVVGLLRMK